MDQASHLGIQGREQADCTGTGSPWYWKRASRTWSTEQAQTVEQREKLIAFIRLDAQVTHAEHPSKTTSSDRIVDELIQRIYKDENRRIKFSTAAMLLYLTTYILSI